MYIKKALASLFWLVKTVIGIRFGHVDLAPTFTTLASALWCYYFWHVILVTAGPRLIGWRDAYGSIEKAGDRKAMPAGRRTRKSICPSKSPQ